MFDLRFEYVQDITVGLYIVPKTQLVMMSSRYVSSLIILVVDTNHGIESDILVYQFYHVTNHNIDIMVYCYIGTTYKVMSITVSE